MPNQTYPEVSDDIYSADFREDLLENDEISAEEEAFMQGYTKAI